ncbi:MAG: hypothetical protein E7332_07525 [Clostridiales bacterium]|nr:hypothetical protein [Clostridiales bacterium]
MRQKFFYKKKAYSEAHRYRARRFTAPKVQVSLKKGGTADKLQVRPLSKIRLKGLFIYQKILKGNDYETQ